MYHYKTKDDLFYGIIEEIVNVELEGLISHIRNVAADQAMAYLLTVLFTCSESKEIQDIMANQNLFDKCHDMVDKIRGKIIIPVFLELMNRGKNEGLFAIEEIDVTCEIIWMGFERYIHNNHHKYRDHKFKEKFLQVASRLCNNTIKPTRIIFEFERGINDESK